MPHLQLSGSAGHLLDRDSHRCALAIRRQRADAQVRMAGVDVETDVALVKLDALTSFTGQAMGAVVRVAQAQRQLEQLAPEASGRLALLADDHVLVLADLAADLRRELRRQ